MELNDVDSQLKFAIARFCDGIKFLAEKSDFTSSLFFGETLSYEGLEEKAFSYIKAIGKHSHWRNPDLFYSLLQYGIYREFVWEQSELEYIKGLNPHQSIAKMIEGCDFEKEYIDKVNQRLSKSLNKIEAEADEPLKEIASSLFSVAATSFSNSEKSVIYTKVNHGYWEFLLNSFVSSLDYSRYRDLSKSSYSQSWMNTGFHAVLFNAFEALFNKGENSGRLKLGIGLSAGDKSYTESIKSGNLTPSTRGALVGLCGFIDALGRSGPIELFEGTAPRDMIKDRYYREFFDRDINNFKAVLLIVPPGLKSLKLSQYKGKVHTLVIPGQVVHETYRVLTPVIISTIRALRAEHGKVCVITQSAVLAPLIAIYTKNFLDEIDDNIAFYDFGRILDIANPQLAVTYPSLSWVVKQGAHTDVTRYFSLRPDLEVGLYREEVLSDQERLNIPTECIAAVLLEQEEKKLSAKDMTEDLSGKTFFVKDMTENLSGKTFFVGIGAQKTGTTWLYDFLSQHKDVYLSPYKEMHVFDHRHVYSPEKLRGALLDRVINHSKLIKRTKGRNSKEGYQTIAAAIDKLSMVDNIQLYANYFEQRVRGEKVFGEITPAYSLLPAAGYKEILSLHSDVKFIFIMRDPIGRAWSHINDEYSRKGIDVGDDEKLIRIFDQRDDNQYFGRSNYKQAIESIESVVNKEDILYLFYEELFLEITTDRICDFLGVEKIDADFSKQVNKGSYNVIDIYAPAIEGNIFGPIYDFCHDKFPGSIPAAWHGS